MLTGPQNAAAPRSNDVGGDGGDADSLRERANPSHGADRKSPGFCSLLARTLLGSGGGGGGDGGSGKYEKAESSDMADTRALLVNIDSKISEMQAYRDQTTQELHDIGEALGKVLQLAKKSGHSAASRGAVASMCETMHDKKHELDHVINPGIKLLINQRRILKQSLVGAEMMQHAKVFNKVMKTGPVGPNMDPEAISDIVDDTAEIYAVHDENMSLVSEMLNVDMFERISTTGENGVDIDSMMSGLEQYIGSGVPETEPERKQKDISRANAAELEREVREAKRLTELISKIPDINNAKVAKKPVIAAVTATTTTTSDEGANSKQPSTTKYFI